MSTGIHIVKRYIFLTFVAVLAAKTRLNSNVFMSDQFGYIFCLVSVFQPYWKIS